MVIPILFISNAKFLHNDYLVVEKENLFLDQKILFLHPYVEGKEHYNHLDSDKKPPSSSSNLAYLKMNS